MAEMTTVTLQKKTRDKLLKIGGMGDSFDDVVNMLIKEYINDE